jgi:hypothetical protein
MTTSPARLSCTSAFSTSSATSSRVRPEPNICSSWRSMAMRFTARAAAGTVAISLSAALRDSSIATVGPAARIVAPRRRPEISPTSPKIDPCSIPTVAFAPTSTSTEPSAMPNIDEPGSLRVKMTSPGA